MCCVHILNTVCAVYIYWIQCVLCTYTECSVCRGHILNTVCAVYMYWIQCVLSILDTVCILDTVRLLDTVSVYEYSVFTGYNFCIQCLFIEYSVYILNAVSGYEYSVCILNTVSVY